MPAPKATKAAITRAIDAVKATGLIPTAVVVAKNGDIRVETTPDTPKNTPAGVDGSAGLRPQSGPKKWAIGEGKCA